jgi:peptide/nickel transport system permease protein
VQLYVQRRLLASVPTLVGISLLIFIAMRVLPGDPVSFTYSEGQGVHILSEEQKLQARASLGLDRPYHEQYLSWMGSVLRGDLGTSFWRGEKTMDLIARRGPITAQIALMAVLLAWLVGIPTGLFSALGRNTVLDYVTRVAVTFLMAIPSFWLGLMVVLGGVLLFTWRPPLSIIYFWDDPIANLQITLGPAIAMGLGLAAVLARFTRSASLEVLGEDYVRTARAKGLRERVVILRHVFKNSLLPIITVSGLALGGLLGGSVAVERAFGVPGLGLALVFALSERDWNVIQNLVLLYGVIFTLVNLAIDLSYAWFDPRIRY